MHRSLLDRIAATVPGYADPAMGLAALAPGQTTAESHKTQIQSPDTLGHPARLHSERHSPEPENDQRSCCPAPAVQFAENPKNLPGPPKTSWLAEVLCILLAFISTGYVLINFLLKLCVGRSPH